MKTHRDDTNTHFFFKFVLPALGIVFAISVFIQEFRQIEFEILHFSWEILILSYILLLGVFFLDAYGWVLVTRIFHVKSTAVETAHIWLTSSLARYIPGVVWGYVQRSNYLIQMGASSRQIFSCFFFESVYLALGGIIVGMNVLWYGVESILESSYLPVIHIDPLVLWSVLIGIVSICLFVVLKIGRQNILAKLTEVAVGPMVWTAAYYLLFWVLFGLTFSFFAYSLQPADIDLAQFLYSGFAFSISFSVAFLLIVFPGGIGIRELLMFYLLEYIYPADVALLLAFGSRLWLLSGEIGSAILAHAIWGRTNPK
jgi:hypothetical protein